MIGVDVAADGKRFTLSDNGIVVIGQGRKVLTDHEHRSQRSWTSR